MFVKPESHQNKQQMDGSYEIMTILYSNNAQLMSKQ